MTHPSPDPRRIGAAFSGDFAGEETEQDRDLAPVAPAERTSTLDSLREELKKQLTEQVTFEPVTLPVEARPGVSLTYSTELDDDRFQAFRKRAKRKDHPDGIDTLRFYCIILADLCTSVNMHGEQVFDDQGDVLTPRHRDIKELFGIPQGGQAAQVVRAIIARDPHVIVHGNKVLEACGYGDEIEAIEEGPTRDS